MRNSDRLTQKQSEIHCPGVTHSSALIIRQRTEVCWQDTGLQHDRMTSSSPCTSNWAWLITVELWDVRAPCSAPHLRLLHSPWNSHALLSAQTCSVSRSERKKNNNKGCTFHFFPASPHWHSVSQPYSWHPYLADRANFNTSTGTKFKTKISRLQKQLWALSSSFTTLRKSVFAHFIAKRGRNGGPVSASVDPQAATAWEFSWSEPQSGCSSTLSGVPAATFRLALLLFPLRCFQRCCSRRQHRQPARNTPAMPSSTAASQETALSKSNLSPQQPLPGYERLTMLLHSWN